MKYAWLVKHDGVYYPAGAEVPVGKTSVKVDKKIEEEKEEAEEVVVPSLTREEVESVNNIMKLRKMAKDNGIATDSTNTMAEVKDAIINGLNL